MSAAALPVSAGPVTVPAWVVQVRGQAAPVQVQVQVQVVQVQVVVLTLVLHLLRHLNRRAE